jgi:rfaE bifunctional protein kinase chain/domain
MQTERLAELIAQFATRRIAVVGDFFLDKYLDIEPALAEPSVETGLTAHQVVRVRHTPGAAGTVVGNLAALGASTLHAVGFTGEDGEAWDLRRDLNAIGCSTTGLCATPDRMTPTYCKPRDMHAEGLQGEHERLDTKNHTPTHPELIQRVVEQLDVLLPQVDAVIVLDQVMETDCGVVTAQLRDIIANRAQGNPDVIFWADSRAKIREFCNVIIKANEFEVVGMVNPLPGAIVEDAELFPAMTDLRAVNHAPVFVSRGAAGMMVSDPEPALIRAVRVEGKIDFTGAGDSVTAGAVLALTAGATLAEAALVGNLVASVTIQQLNTTGTASPEQLTEQLKIWQQQESEQI